MQVAGLARRQSCTHVTTHVTHLLLLASSFTRHATPPCHVPLDSILACCSITTPVFFRSLLLHSLLFFHLLILLPLLFFFFFLNKPPPPKFSPFPLPAPLPI